MRYGDLPTEAWYKIFDIACKDGGATGCALSLVSRRVRDESRPYQVQTAALYGPLKLQIFLETISLRKEHERRVRWLFIANTVSLETETDTDAI
jgi:hypothetical protein